MSTRLGDIYTEPSDVDPDTLHNLGPLAALAGSWEGRGVDVNPSANGMRTQEFDEVIELQPIDPQTNGPQLLYGLRYHTRITQPGEPGTYHDQVGYWLWEPATGAIYQTLAIPRAQVALAMGKAEATAREFEVHAERGSPINGICTNPFVDAAFETVEYRIVVTVHDDGSWSYDEDTVLRVAGREGLFHHTDRNRLRRVAAPESNPLVR